MSEENENVDVPVEPAPEAPVEGAGEPVPA